MSRNKILFIHYLFPPSSSTATRRNAYIFKNLKSHFDDHFVFTTKNQLFFPKETIYDAFVDKKENVKQLSTVDFRTLANWIRPKKLGAPKAIHVDEKLKARPIVKFIRKVLDGFPFNLILHEGGIIYTCAGVYHGYKLIKNEQITHIWSSFRPYSDHFTAYILKRMFPKIVWIADFRDLHVEPLYQNVYFEPFQHWCNRLIIKRANLVTTVSEGLAGHLTKYNPNVHVLRSGIVLDTDFDVPQQPKFTIAYTGSMFREERNPTLLAQVVKSLADEKLINPDNFSLIYAGKDSAIFKKYINQHQIDHFLDDRGMLTTQEAINLQKSAHVNLLLTSATADWTGVMTGKFWEYLSTAKPIIVLINGANDQEFETLINDLEAGCVVYTDRSFENLRTFILEKFKEWQTTGAVKSTTDLEKLKAFTWENQVKELVKKIF